MASFFFLLGRGPLPKWLGTWVLTDTWQWLVTASLWGLGKPRPPFYFFNSQLQLNLGGLGNVFIIGLKFLLTRNLIVKILTPCHEICGATDNNFSSLSWSVTAWKLTCSRSAEISDPQVCLTVASEGADRAAKRILFCLPESSGALLSDILVSLSWSLATEPRRSQGG